MADLERYLKRARGGRVVRTGFLDPEDQARLEEMARREGIRVAFFGGFPLAERKVAVLYPEEVPSVSDPVEVVLLDRPPPADLGEVLGEVEEVEEGVLAALLPEGRKALEAQGYRLLPPPEGALRPPRERVRTLVVPSLRVDAVGAKGFGVSRPQGEARLPQGRARPRGPALRGGARDPQAPGGGWQDGAGQL